MIHTTNRSIIQGLKGSNPFMRVLISRNKRIKTLTDVWFTFSSNQRLKKEGIEIFGENISAMNFKPMTDSGEVRLEVLHV